MECLTLMSCRGNDSVVDQLATAGGADTKVAKEFWHVAGLLVSRLQLMIQSFPNKSVHTIARSVQKDSAHCILVMC